MFDIFSFDFILLAALACILLTPEDFVSLMGLLGKTIKHIKLFFKDDPKPITIEVTLQSSRLFPYTDNQKSAFASPL